ncbi:ABC transporter permease [Bordetella ansorpii]|jgi:peptide/nickel transport system permease protein|uniref:ABC transporter permease n=1 Tax=Bordetella ansorpii TaxID=288768 RepID=A0A157NF23_9BORD|nr:ABC transporter permease [Bordetella ansorpii]SAI19389.1 ABC transporter permease [Bordetella ansorpii]
MSRRTLALVGRRTLMAIPILFGVVVVTFMLIHVLPGDPAAMYASGPNAGPAEIQAVRLAMGLDKPLPEQFLIYLQHLAQLDLGRSMSTGQTVLHDFSERLPATIELAVFAFTLSVAIALPLGVLAALYRDSPLDQAIRAITSISAAMPGFFFGLILIFFFYYLWGLAPEPIGRLSGWSFPPERVTGFFLIDALLAGDTALMGEAAAKMVLPAASMAIFAIAPLMRMMRGGMIDALDSDYVRAARAYGLAPWRVTLQYALPNAMLPVLATMGMVISTMLGANIMIEKLFGWPGIGAYAINALVGLDYAPVQAFVLIVATLFVLLTLAIDIVSSLIDPRYQLKD